MTQDISETETSPAQVKITRSTEAERTETLRRLDDPTAQITEQGVNTAAGPVAASLRVETDPGKSPVDYDGEPELRTRMTPEQYEQAKAIALNELFPEQPMEVVVRPDPTLIVTAACVILFGLGVFSGVVMQAVLQYVN